MIGFPNKAVLLTAGAVAAAAVLAGCGGGSSKPTTSTSASGSAGDPATQFSVANVSGVGNVVVDGQGRTVYVLTSGGKTNVPCTDASGCTNLWPDSRFPAVHRPPRRAPDSRHPCSGRRSSVTARRIRRTTAG